MKSGFIVILNPILFAKIHKKIIYLKQCNRTLQIPWVQIVMALLVTKYD